MKLPPRWPLHPAPKEGEALSSWLNRVAACYQIDVHDLLEHDLGHGDVNNLDISPPISLLAALGQRSGIELDRLRCMTFSGWVPWLLDSLDPLVPASLQTYAYELSVLLLTGSRKTRSITRWCAWLPSQPISRACPSCLNDSAGQAILLVWKLPLMLSCPLHGCRLESYSGMPGRSLVWEKVNGAHRMPNEAVTAMDRRTWQALTTGHVELPRRRIHAGLWFRLLRTLLDELNTPMAQCGDCDENIRCVWRRCGYPLRGGQGPWQPYETLDETVQLQMLEAAARAIELMESRFMTPRGEQAHLFSTEPPSRVSSGLVVEEKMKESANDRQAIIKAFDESLLKARHDPELARSLFAEVTLGKRDPWLLARMRAVFVEEGIPSEYLSHYEADEPFTCRRLSN